jgi:peptidoglycan hydrolase-like protein with peptidoglycan-binding domain
MQNNQAQQGRIQQGQGSVTLSADQRTRIRETVLTGSNVPRVNNVNFALRVGTVVPTSVRVLAVPDVLIGFHPEWRGHSYFVVSDDIIIVDREQRIIATVPVGSSGAQLDNRGPQFSGGAGGGGGASMSVEEIRQVQIALSQQGFDVGEPDGKLGPQTRQALILFQRQNGLQATGQIDRQTFTTVTASVSQRGNQGGTSTTGQGGASQPPANQGSAQPQGNSPSGTTGQGGNMTQQPPANQPSGNQPSAQPQANQQQGKQPDQSTTGQGGAGPANRGPSNNMNPSAQPGGASPQSNAPAGQSR